MSLSIAASASTVLRESARYAVADANSWRVALDTARSMMRTGDFQSGVDIFEQLIESAPQHATELLSELYDSYQALPQKDNRYHLYVSRYFQFGIKPTDKVLDIGSGHDPFPFATHLADFAPEDDAYGRAGAPLKRIAGKPFYACSVEDMPFEDKEFDFVYCSHVLEHTEDPGQACRELMRVAKRGYIETPTQAKDLFLNTAFISNHHWDVQSREGCLTFRRYREEDRKGLGSDILMEMHCAPQTPREKAISSLILLKSKELNSMIYWENSFQYQVIP